MEVDVIHTYIAQPNIFDESSVGYDELDSCIALVAHTGPSMPNLDLDTFGAYSIGLTSLFTRDNTYHINNLEPVISLSLAHPDLIDWSV